MRILNCYTVCDKVPFKMRFSECYNQHAIETKSDTKCMEKGIFCKAKKKNKINIRMIAHEYECLEYKPLNELNVLAVVVYEMVSSWI